MLARAAGIPARVVTGYQGGEYNPIERLSADPPVGCARVVGGLARRARLGARRSDGRGRAGTHRERDSKPRSPRAASRCRAASCAQSALLTQLRLAWDAANTFWNNQVVAFGEAQQRWLLERLNIDDADWEQLGIALVADAGRLLRASCPRTWRGASGRAPSDPLAQIYEQLCRKLARHGLPRAAHEGPSDYVDARVAGCGPSSRSSWWRRATLYVALRYGPRSWGPQLNRSELSRLKFLVNQLKV